MLRAGRLQALRRVDLEHVARMRREHGREERREPENQDQHEADERRAVPGEAREDEERAPHDIRSRGSTTVWARSTSRLTARKIVPAHTVKPITAL